MANAPLTNVEALAYIASYADLSAIFGADADAGRVHYERFGVAEGRQITFKPLSYIASYADLIGAYGLDAEAGARHFIQFGRAEGRAATFDVLRYIASHIDLVRAYGTDVEAGARHFIQFGRAEGRGATFDALNYIASYDDLVRTYGSDVDAGLRHYIRFGSAEGRAASFDTLRYIASYTDLTRAFGTDTTAAVRHYLVNGFAEGRRASFDPVAYLLTEPDLAAAGLTPAEAIYHYVRFGLAEGRVGDAAYGREQTSFVLDSSVTGRFDTSGDRDYYEVQLSAGEQIEFSLQTTQAGTRPYVMIADQHGVSLAGQSTSYDASGALAFTAPRDGLYYVSVARGADGADPASTYSITTRTLTTVPGTPGPDTLTGTAASEIFRGNAGDDTITDSAGGADYLFGGDGNDTLFVERNRYTVNGGNILLDGGAGNDNLRVQSIIATISWAAVDLTGRATILGGAGNDTIDLVVESGSVDAGDGDDRIIFAAQGAQITFTLGAGADVLEVGPGIGLQYKLETGTYRVTDFNASEDRLILGGILTGYIGQTSNPFEDGFLRLVQSGADTLLQQDESRLSPSYPGGYTDLFIFENVQAASITAAQIGIDPGPFGRIIEGTAAGESLVGGAGSDTLRGYAGNDILFGGARHDTLEGGNGDDQLYGESGNDILAGGAGNDQLYGGLGDDHLYGNSPDDTSAEAGADILIDTDGGNDQLFGQGGTDTLVVVRTGDVAASTVLLDGGAGDDILTFASDRRTDSVTATGGAGDDIIQIGLASFIRIDAGAGDDQVTVSMRGNDRAVSLGAGNDVLTFGSMSSGAPAAAALIVADFKVAEDRVEMAEFLGDVLDGWDGQSNPFAGGFLRLTQSGTSALLEIDRDGGGDSFQGLAIFQQAMAANFTAAELGYAPFPVEQAASGASADPLWEASSFAF